MTIPVSIARHLRELLMAQVGPCLLRIGPDYRVETVVGDAARYGLGQVRRGDDAREHLAFLHGADLQPPIDRPLHWPMIAVADDVYADVLIKAVQDGASMLLLTDVSREHAERQASQQHAHEVELLNRRLRRTLRQLEAARGELEEKNRELDELNQLKSGFIASLSHELRTPLTSILGHVELLRDRVPVAEPDALMESLKAIEAGSGHLMSLVNNILDHASIETGQLALNPVPTDLRALFEDVCVMVRPMAAQGGLQFRFRLSGNLPLWVDTDATRLRQAVINLVTNAIKYTPAGFVELAGHWVDGILDVRVTDSGPGISPDQRERIFLPFQRGQNIAGRHGVGLGLAISSQLVKLLGGELQLEDREGGGSIFGFAIPARMAGGGKPMRDPPPRRVYGREGERRAVLLIDDAYEIRLLYANVLETMGYAVDEAPDEETALQRFTIRRPDIIIVDLHLGNRDSAGLIRRLRELGHNGLIAAWSASSLREDRERVLAAGADAYLVKPVPPPVLQQALEQLAESGGADE
jgi:signal transduction histidine kinase/CheY-like chemotaxis protein